ncbi:samB [Candida jiufengensis]|uniref:samB n=1 Tax=Candida jiufengensis TaxID=497108 RepID=UPI002224FB4D|nr:samB [Candida jiufengensis]KAI5952382.1 samB [Candida jiufengensis]
MRDSNFRAISSNKAAVTITTSLYDRRALDVTSDKPLVNSLNYLTYLVSSSAKVRETLSIDGGIERLIEILHECHNFKKFINDNDEKQILIAWKWTLAFQCLVLIGTRGTEKIRQKVVKAGILPIIATVLDNYISLHERSFLHNNNNNTNNNGVLGCNNNNNHSNSNLNLNLNQGNEQDEQQLFLNTVNDIVNPFHSHFQNQFQNQISQNEQIINNGNGLRYISPTNINSDQTLVNQNVFQQQQQEQSENPIYSNTRLNTNDEDEVEEAIIDGNFLNMNINNNQDNNNTTTNNNNGNNNYYSQFSAAAAAFEATSISTNQSNLLMDQFISLKDIDLQDIENSSIEHLIQLLKLSKYENNEFANDENNILNTSIELDIKRNFITLNLLEKLKEIKETESFSDNQNYSINYEENYNDTEYDMDSNLQFLSDLYQRNLDINGKNNSSNKLAVRSFTKTGVVIPKDDDIVWSLQLLAYISKYPYLKDILQNTHLILNMSIRDKQIKLYIENQLKLSNNNSITTTNTTKSSRNSSISTTTKKYPKRETIIPKSRKKKLKTTFLERFNPSASNSPQMITSLNDDDDNLILKDDKFNLCNNHQNLENGQVNLNEGDEIEENAEVEDDDEDEEDDEEEDDDEDEEDPEDEEEEDLEESLSNSSEDDSTIKDSNPKDNYLKHFYNSIQEINKIENALLKKIKYNQLNLKLNNFIEFEFKKLSILIIQKRQQYKTHLKTKWNYENYKNFDIDDISSTTSSTSSTTSSPTFTTTTQDLDSSLFEIQKLNLFPLVENFTFLSGTDMYYWSGVIMRNSCRRNDLKGGIRQCGNLKCSKWETYPREFSKCRRCKRTKYCSRDCQMKAWHCHRNWCIPSSSSSSSTITNNTVNTNTMTNTTTNNNNNNNNDNLGGNNNNNTNG